MVNPASNQKIAKDSGVKLESLTNEYNKLSKQNNDLSRTVKNLTDENSRLKTANTQLQGVAAEKAAARDTIQSLMKQLAETNQHLVDTNDELIATKRQAESLKAMNINVEKTHQQQIKAAQMLYEKAVEHASEEREKLQKELSKAAKAQKQDPREMPPTVDQLQTEQARLQNENLSQANEIRRLKAALSLPSQELVTTKTQLTQAREQLQKTSQERDVALDNVASIKRDQAELQKQLKAREAEIPKLQQERQETLGTLKMTIVERDELAGHLKGTTKDLEIQKDINRQQEAAMRAMQEQIAKLQEALHARTVIAETTRPETPSTISTEAPPPPPAPLQEAEAPIPAPPPLPEIGAEKDLKEALAQQSKILETIKGYTIDIPGKIKKKEKILGSADKSKNALTALEQALQKTKTPDDRLHAIEAAALAHKEAIEHEHNMARYLINTKKIWQASLASHAQNPALSKSENDYKTALSEWKKAHQLAKTTPLSNEFIQATNGILQLAKSPLQLASLENTTETYEALLNASKAAFEAAAAPTKATIIRAQELLYKATTLASTTYRANNQPPILELLKKSTEEALQQVSLAATKITESPQTYSTQESQAATNDATAYVYTALQNSLLVFTEKSLSEQKKRELRALLQSVNQQKETYTKNAQGYEDHLDAPATKTYPLVKQKEEKRVAPKSTLIQQPTLKKAPAKDLKAAVAEGMKGLKKAAPQEKRVAPKPVPIQQFINKNVPPKDFTGEIAKQQTYFSALQTQYNNILTSLNTIQQYGEQWKHGTAKQQEASQAIKAAQVLLSIAKRKEEGMKFPKTTTPAEEQAGALRALQTEINDYRKTISQSDALVKDAVRLHRQASI